MSRIRKGIVIEEVCKRGHNKVLYQNNTKRCLICTKLLRSKPDYSVLPVGPKPRKKCSVEGCSRNRKVAISHSSGHTGRYGWSVGLYCSMHYERLRRTGSLGPSEPKVIFGRPWIGTNGYYKCTVNGKEVYLHRVIWKNNKGRIPKGYHIHHIDGNKLNNDITNLQLISSLEHFKLHSRGKRAKNAT